MKSNPTQMARQWVESKDWDSLSKAVLNPIRRAEMTQQSAKVVGDACIRHGLFDVLAKAGPLMERRGDLEPFFGSWIRYRSDSALAKMQPIEKWLALPEDNPFRSAAINSAAVRVLEGDFEFWEKAKSIKEVREKLFPGLVSPEAASHGISLRDLAELAAKGAQIPQDLLTLAQADAAKSDFGSEWVPERWAPDITEGGMISKRESYGPIHHRAAKNNDPALLKVVMDWRPFEEYGHTGRSAIDSALAHGSFECVEAILERDPYAALRPRHFAASYNDGPGALNEGRPVHWGEAGTHRPLIALLDSLRPANRFGYNMQRQAQADHARGPGAGEGLIEVVEKCLLPATRLSEPAKAAWEQKSAALRSKAVKTGLSLTEAIEGLEDAVLAVEKASGVTPQTMPSLVAMRAAAASKLMDELSAAPKIAPRVEPPKIEALVDIEPRRIEPRQWREKKVANKAPGEAARSNPKSWAQRRVEAGEFTLFAPRAKKKS